MADDLVVVGKMGAPFGVKGWLKLQSNTTPETNILSYQPLLIQRGGQWQPLVIEEYKVQAQQIIIKIEGCHDRDVARTYTHCAIGMQASQLPELPEGEYYWRDLIGLTVINHDDTVLGKVTDLMETGANDVLIVKGDSEIAIPYLLGDVILNIDLQAKIIRVAWDMDFI